jgi:hypothetical protein
MKKRLTIGLLYLSLHNQLKKKVGINKIITRREFNTILGKHFLIPRNIRCVVIKEMEDKKLIKKMDKEHIQICECEFDLEKDANKFYKAMKIF